MAIVYRDDATKRSIVYEPSKEVKEALRELEKFDPIEAHRIKMVAKEKLAKQARKIDQEMVVRAGYSLKGHKTA